MNHSTHATRHKKADTIVTHIVLIAVCAVFFFPVLWLIMASFSRSGSIYDIGGFSRIVSVWRDIAGFLWIPACMIIPGG